LKPQGELGLKITAIQPWAVAEPGGRRYVILRIDTDAGIAGYGEAPALPNPQTAVDSLKRELAELPGSNPARILQVEAALASGGSSPAARAAVNIALMDILGKSAKAPLYEALGGPTRNKARAMAVVEGGSTSELRDAVIQAKRAGHRAFSIPLHMPAGMERGRAFYVGIRKRLDELRAAAGSDCDFVLDCAGRPTPGEALSIADRVEDFHLLWLDEPCGELSAAARASISGGSVTPVGFGRYVTRNGELQDLLREDGIDVLRPDITLNGVTNVKKAAAIAETYYVALCPYNRGGPIATAVGIHVAACLPNSFIQETPFSVREADRRVRREIAGGWSEQPEDGWFALLQGHGLGLTIDEAAVQKYAVAS
jgi:galactonate dehydratase